jgi:hypothetical protein
MIHCWPRVQLLLKDHRGGGGGGEGKMGEWQVMTRKMTGHCATGVGDGQEEETEAEEEGGRTVIPLASHLCPLRLSSLPSPLGGAEVRGKGDNECGVGGRGAGGSETRKECRLSFASESSSCSSSLSNQAPLSEDEAAPAGTEATLSPPDPPPPPPPLLPPRRTGTATGRPLRTWCELVLSSECALAHGTHRQAHTRRQARAHTHTRTRTRTRTQAHTHTRTHAHAWQMRTTVWLHLEIINEHDLNADG